MIHTVSISADEELVSTFRVSLVTASNRTTTPSGFSLESKGRLADVVKQARSWGLYMQAKGCAISANALLVEETGRPSSQFLDAPQGFPFTSPLNESAASISRFPSADLLAA